MQGTASKVTAENNANDNHRSDEEEASPTPVRNQFYSKLHLSHSIKLNKNEPITFVIC